APPPLPPSLTTTGPSAIQVLAPFCCSGTVYTQARQARTALCANGCFVWAAIGLALCIVVGTAAGIKSKRAGSNFFESEVYGMTAATHRRFVWVTLPFAALFAASYVFARIPVVPL